MSSTKIFSTLEEDLRRLVKNRAFWLVAVLVLLLASAAVLPGTVTDSGDKEPELTKYQQNFVDCPDQYLKLCTRMSKIPTTPVSYLRTEGDNLYLETGDGRTMVVRIQEGGEDGYLVRIEE